MGVNSFPKTITRQRRNCDLNPGPSAPESSMLKAGSKRPHCDNCVCVCVQKYVPKIAPSYGEGMCPHLTNGSLGPPEIISQTALQLVHLFL